MKKGFTFSLEAVVAVVIMFTFIIIVSSMSFVSISQEISYERLHHLSQDVSELMAKTRVIDAGNFSPIKEYLEEGIITQEDLNKTILDVIGSFWAQGNISYARNITESILNKTLQENFGYEILMNSDTISRNSLPQRNFLSRSSVIVSGYSVGKPIEGYSARASLEKIKGKTTSSFIYFGGFVGQGNLTAIVRDIPADANITNIKIEANFGDNFTLYVNGNLCKNFVKSPGDFSVDSWNVNEPICLNNVTKGVDNVFNINFTGSDVTKKYIGGGFIKVEYSTSQMSEQISNSTKYFFPGIDGFINHYDSFYVPGNITSMSIYLRFLSNYSAFLNMGNITVFNSTGSESVQTITIDNSTLSSLINYSEISLITVPLRFGIEALNMTQLGNADVILVTDLSGSMNWDMTSENTGVERSCNDPRLYDNDTKRLSLAKCLDKEFVDTILNTSGNRVGLSAFYADTSPPYKGRVTYHDLSVNRTSLRNEIDSYWARGGTCICCSINNAYNILNIQSNASRMKYVVVMSDGIPTHQCGTSGVKCQGTRDGTPNNEGLWLGWGAGCYGGLEDCVGTDCQCAMQNANWSSCRVRNLNSTVYSIGFGPVSQCTNANWTLQAIANCGGGSYYFSGNATQLKEIYRIIAQNIVNASLIRQAVNVTGVTNTTLYPDSFISFNFTPAVIQYGYGEISIKVETNPFENCSGNFFVPQQFTVDEIGVTSYSADYWTNNLFINNSATGGWKNVFNLTSFSSNYTRLGDPYIIKFPATYVLSNEVNYVNITLGISPTNVSSNCSNKNRAIYTARLRVYTSYSGVFSKAQGKNVTVYFDRDHDGVADGFTYVAIGKDLPNFNPVPITVDDLNITSDALDFTFLDLLGKLNFVIMPFNSGRPGSSTNPIDLEITSEIIIESLYIPGIYTLWGPAIFEVRVWV